MTITLDPLEEAAFDEQLPLGLQMKAGSHFTPISVARYAATMLAPTPGMSVLDVGSGAGKFCITAAHAVPYARFVGVEWRGHLVQLATRLGREAGLENVRFIHGDALDLDWTEYDAFYLYNPFAEQVYDRPFLIDETIAFDPTNFWLYVMAVRERLATAKIGTRLVTYWGFGAPPPLGYDLVQTVPVGSDCLELWVKTTSREVRDGSPVA